MYIQSTHGGVIRVQLSGRLLQSYSKDAAEWRNSGFQRIFYRISRRSKI